MAVTREVADRIVVEAGWHVSDFEDAMLDGHDIDDEVAPVAWGVCKHYDRGPYGGGGTGATGAGGL